MNLVDMTQEERLDMQRKRCAYFKSIANKYNSLEEFIKDNDEKFAILGIELIDEKKYVSLRLQLDYSEYDQYHIIPTPSGQLTCSHVIWFQDEYCANFIRNLRTKEYLDDEDDILNEY